jgi:hypothetical protein
MEINYNWLPKGITVEDSEDTVEVKYGDKLLGVYSYRITEEQLKDNISKMNLESILNDIKEPVLQ